MIKLEAVHDNRNYAPKCLRPIKPWVAKVEKNGLNFLQGQRDYSEANRDGSRWVYDYYYLYEGALYRIKEYKNSTILIDYYCIVINNKLKKLSEDEVKEWQRNI